MKRKLLLVLTALVVLTLLIASIASAGFIQLSNDSGTGKSYYAGWRGDDIVGAVLVSDPGWYFPVQVDSVEFMLHQFPGAGGYAMMRAHVYSIVDGAPGQLLGSSETEQISIFYPDWASISLASVNIMLGDAPFMVAVEYTAGVGGSTPAIMLDDQINIAVGKNWYFWPPTWYEHYVFWSHPEDGGYNMIRVTLNVPEEPPPPPTSTPHVVYIPEVMKNHDPSVSTPVPTATYTPIPRPTMPAPTITPLFLSPLRYEGG